MNSLFSFGTIQTGVNAIINAGHALSSGKAAAPAHVPPAKALRRSVEMHATQYIRPGRHTVASQPVLVKSPMGVGPTGPVEVQIEAYHPVEPSPAPSGWPLALLSPGFLLNSSLYRSYAASLASWGFVVGLVDLLSDGLLDDTLSTVRVIGREPASPAAAAAWPLHQCKQLTTRNLNPFPLFPTPCPPPKLMPPPDAGVPALSHRPRRARRAAHRDLRRPKRDAGRPLARRQDQRAGGGAGEARVLTGVMLLLQRKPFLLVSSNPNQH
jgi:hypothetical protein